VLAAAEAGQLAFCDVSASPHVASGIAPISAQSLARLIMPPDPSDPLSTARPEAPLP
jgi:flagellar biosynthesis protein FlhF